MKKIIIIFILALTATFSFGQSTWTVPQNLGGNKTLVTIPGGLSLPNGIILGSFPDSLAANLSNIKLYEGAYVDIAGVLHRRKSNKWVIANLAPRDTIYILATGQSNSAGGAEDAIDTASDVRMQGWDSQINQWVQYRVGFRPSYTLYPSQGGSGYPIGPSAQFFFARKLAREKDVIVRVVNWGIGGQPISQWHNGTTKGPYMDIIANMTAVAGVPKYDYVIWDQGEANNGTTPLIYKISWDSVKASFRRYSWFPATTKIAVVGMPRQYNGAPTGYQGIDPTLQSFDGNEDPYDGYANTDSATVNAVGAADGGVRIHFNSKGLKHLGEQTIWATFESLPSRYGDPGQSERFDLITPGRIYIGHGGSNTIKDANGIFNSGWESNTVVTPTYAENARWEASSMTKNTTGSYNTAMGRESMNRNESGYWNSAYGAQSLNGNVSGFRNSAFGLQSLFRLASGNDNTTLGYRAGSDLQSGSYNVILGSSAATRLNGRNNWMLFADGFGTERFTVDSAGNFGINTVAPTEKLTVAGNIKFTGLAFENNDTLANKAYVRSLMGSGGSPVTYGTTAGTAAEGNDSRINNGQTAFGWGDHSTVGYALTSSLSNYLLSSTAASTYALKNIDTNRLVNPNIHAAIAKAITDTMNVNALNVSFGLVKSAGNLFVDSLLVTSRAKAQNDSTTLAARINALGGGAIDATPTDGSTNAVSSNGVFDALATKQVSLVSGGNIRTVNGQTLLGSTDLVVTAGIDDHPQIKLMQGLGSQIKAQNFPAFEATTATGLSDGQARFWAVYLAKGQTITGIQYYQTVQGNYTADASNQVALYVPNPATGDLTQVAVSANDGTNLWKQAVNTTYKVPFTSPYAASAGVYYVALLYNSSAQTTAPTILARSGGSNAAQSQLDNTGLFALSMTLAGQTSLSATYNTTPSMAASTTHAWVSIY